MNCPICNQEMTEGKIQIYEMGSFILHMPATMKFIPDDKTKKSVKADRFQEMKGYCCKKCKKIVSIASIGEKWLNFGE